MSTEADEEQLRIALAVLFRRHAVDGVLTVFDTEIEDDDDEATFIVESLKDGVRVTLVPAFVKTGLDLEAGDGEYIPPYTTFTTDYTTNATASGVYVYDNKLYGSSGSIYLSPEITASGPPATKITGTFQANGTWKLTPDPIEVK